MPILVLGFKSFQCAAISTNEENWNIIYKTYESLPLIGEEKIV